MVEAAPLGLDALPAVGSGSGVYVIVSTSGKLYVGSSECMRKRKNSHLSALRRGRHVNQHLQRSFNLYGETSLSFLCLERCPVDALPTREQAWLDRLWGDGECLYNTYRTAYVVRGEDHPLYGKPRSEEVKAAIRAKRKMQVVKHSVETRAKIGAASRGRVPSAETRAKISRSKAGRSPAWSRGLTMNDPSAANLRAAAAARRKPIPAEDARAMLIMYQEGESVSSIVREFGHSWKVVRRCLQQQGATLRSISEQKRLRDQKE